MRPGPPRHMCRGAGPCMHGPEHHHWHMDDWATIWEIPETRSRDLGLSAVPEPLIADLTGMLAPKGPLGGPKYSRIRERGGVRMMFRGRTRAMLLVFGVAVALACSAVAANAKVATITGTGHKIGFFPS